MTAPAAPRRIGFLLIDGYALMSTAAAVEPLRAANLLAGRALYDLVFLSLEGPGARASVGAWFGTTPIARAGRSFDIVFVVAGGQPLGFAHAGLRGFLRDLAAHGVALGGISGGAAMLAEAGLMENRRFTIHWQHYEALRARSDRFLMERRRYVIDRDRYTCAGGSAPLDMMHAMIAAQHGAGFARRISDWFIHTEIRPPEDPQHSGPAARYGLRDPRLVAAVGLMESHIADPLSLSQLAALAGLGPRQLQRHFTDGLGLTAMQFYRRLRLDTAAHLLAQTGLPVAEVAEAAGFSNLSHFAAAFGRQHGLSPSRYRAGTGAGDGG